MKFKHIILQIGVLLLFGIAIEMLTEDPECFIMISFALIFSCLLRQSRNIIQKILDAHRSGIVSRVTNNLQTRLNKLRERKNLQFNKLRLWVTDEPELPIMNLARTKNLWYNKTNGSVVGFLKSKKIYR
jgi:hypothetical protein